MLVYLDPCHNSWLLNLVYCPAQNLKNNLFWDKLNTITEAYPSPMLVIRDFNSVLNQFENIGDKPVANPSTPTGLQLYMDNQGLIDLGFSGPKFSWSNNRHGSHNNMKRLDRGIMNLQQNNLFPNASIKYLTRSASDHSPMVLDTNNSHNSPKSFKFEEF